MINIKLIYYTTKKNTKVLLDNKRKKENGGNYRFNGNKSEIIASI